MTQSLACPSLRVRVLRTPVLVFAAGCLAHWADRGDSAQLFAQTTRPPATARVGAEPAPRTNGVSPRVSTAPGAASNAGAVPKGGQAIRPVAAEMKVPAVEAMDPAMWKVLQDWEEATKDIKALYAEHQRYVYDATFLIEKRGEGKVWYESPDHGRYEVEPMNVKGLTTKKKGPKGEAYTLKAHESEKWICTGAQVIQVHEERKEFERVTIPVEDRGMNMMNGPLPFIIGMKAEQARRRYFLQLIKHVNGEYWIHAKPRFARDATLWSDAIVILDEKTFLPRAVQLTDPTGNQTTTHTFQNMDPRTKEFAKTGLPAFIAGGDPFKFTGRGYQEVVNNDAAGPEGEPGAPRPGNRSPIPPTSLEGRQGTKLAQPPGLGTKRGT